MTYSQALEKAEQIGASNSEGKVLLAILCQCLAYVHAINPALVYQGAVRQGLDNKALAKLAKDDPAGLGDLMFV